MNAKLKIDITHGLIEVEGSEEFIAKIYDDFKSRISATRPIAEAHAKPHERHEDVVNQKSPEKKKTPAPRAKAGAPPTFVKDLNLASQNGKPSLKDFSSAFAAKSAMDWNLLFTYYLTKHIEISPISLDHLYTCYKVLGVKPPAAFNQSIVDTANRKGWLDSKSTSDIKLTMVGENHVDHDFPRKTSDD